jgi:sugar lactone lactonase YvrE
MLFFAVFPAGAIAAESPAGESPPISEAENAVASLDMVSPESEPGESEPGESELEGEESGKHLIEAHGEPIAFHGGYVQHNPHVYVIFWGSDWNKQSTAKEDVLALYRALPNSSYGAILTQYFDYSGPINNDTALTSFTDTRVSHPGEATEEGIHNEVHYAINHDPTWQAAWEAPNRYENQYVVFTPPGTTNHATGGCGYHGWNAESWQISFTYIPWPDSDCQRELGAGNTLQVIASHEWAESATDPIVDPIVNPSFNEGLLGWAYGSQGEIADLCQTLNALEHESIASGVYAQRLYDNYMLAAHGTPCVISDPSPERFTANMGSTSVSTETHRASLWGSIYPAGWATGYTFELSGPEGRVFLPDRQGQQAIHAGYPTQLENIGGSLLGQQAPSALTGVLKGNTTYNVHLYAMSLLTYPAFVNDGASWGAMLGGSTQITTPDWRPAISPGSPTFPATHDGTLGGTVNPEGYASTYQIEWGPTTSYGSTIPATAAPIGSGVSPVAISQAITGLKGSTTYHFRIVATNSEGTAYSPDQTFTTPDWRPIVVAKPASGVTEEEATLNGTVNPQELDTQYQFEYGLSPSYGTAVPIATEDVGSGAREVHVSQRIAELRPETTYYYRVKATNAEGTSYSDAHTLTTFSTLASPVSFDREFSWVGEGVDHLSRPTGVAVDPMGNVWVADTGNNRVVEFDSEGNFVTQFGSEPDPEHPNNPTVLDEPSGIVVNNSDEILVADRGNTRLVKFNNAGGFRGEWGVGAGEECCTHLLSAISGVTIGSEERYLVTDPRSGVLYGFRPLANSHPEVLSGLFAAPSTPYGEQNSIAAGPNGAIWVTDRLRDQVNEQHLIEVHGQYTGVYQPAELSNAIGSPGSGPGQLDEPTGVALRPSGNLLVADTGNNRIEQFSPKGELLAEFGSSGSGEGEFNRPEGIATAPGGVEYVADTGNNRIEKWLQPGLPEAATEGLSGGTSHEVTLHGTAWANGRAATYHFEYGTTTSYGKSAPAPAISIGFGFGASPVSQTLTGLSAETTYHYRLVAVNKQGTAYGEDRTFTTGAVGKPTIVYGSAVGSSGTGNGQFLEPSSSFVDSEGNLWVLDSGNCRVEKFNEKGEYLSKFGSKCSSSPGYLHEPTAMTMDKSGDIWIAERYKGGRIQVFTQTGTLVRTIEPGTTNGLVLQPFGITSDSNGHIWVADTYNNRIQEFSEKGEFIKAVGSYGTGPGQFIEPQSISVGPNGNLWIAVYGDDQVVELTEAGEFIRSFEPKGPGKEPGSALGAVVDPGNRVWVLGPENDRVVAFTEKGEYLAQFGSRGKGVGQFEASSPAGISLDAKGNLWVTDSSNGRVERWEPSP